MGKVYLADSLCRYFFIPKELGADFCKWLVFTQEKLTEIQNFVNAVKNVTIPFEFHWRRMRIATTRVIDSHSA